MQPTASVTISIHTSVTGEEGISSIGGISGVERAGRYQVVGLTQSS